MQTEQKSTRSRSWFRIVLWGFVVSSWVIMDAGCSSNKDVCKDLCEAGYSYIDGVCQLSCPSGQIICGKKCVDPKTDREHCSKCDQPCKSGEICKDAKCELSCPDGQTICSGLCIDTRNDANNCGKCGEICSDGQICTDGKCSLSCPSHLTKCDTICLDTNSDPKNCGKCKNACKPDEYCLNGKCSSSCPKELTDCNGACVDLQIHPLHCGACKNACKDGEICQAGKCTFSCPKGLTDCDGVCIDLQTNPLHCGACKNACKSGEFCVKGKCDTVCPDGMTICDGTCVDLQTNPLHCGTCNNSCTPGSSCIKGKCEGCCPTGFIFCKDQCVNPNTDRSNCGACSISCLPGQICNAGKCEWNCPSDFILCKDQCVNPNTDRSNCGACSISCLPGQICNAGKCEWNCPSDLTECSDKCVDTKIDPQNCGKCANACLHGAQCKNGICECAHQTEICGNGIDDDCNGLIDDGCPLVVSAGDSDDDYAQSVYADNQGNIYVTGRFYNTLPLGHITLTSQGSSDIFVTKLDSTGKVLWAVSGGGEDDDYGNDIAADNQGNVYVTGSFAGSSGSGTGTGGTLSAPATFGHITTHSKDDSKDIFVAKLDKDGKWLWVATGGGDNSDEGNGLRPDNLGNVFVTGQFCEYYPSIFDRSAVIPSSSNVTFGTINNVSSNGGCDIFVAKLDKDGNWLWAKNAGGSNDDAGYGLDIDAQLNVYITGYFEGTSADFGTISIQAPNYNTEVFVAKLDKDGNWLWAKNAGSSAAEYAYGIGVNPSGDVAIAGRFMGPNASFGSHTITHSHTGTLGSNSDIFVAKLDKDGNWQWAHSFGSPSYNDYGYGAAVDTAGNVYLSAYFGQQMRVGSNTLISKGGSDLFVAKFNSTGQLQWHKHWGGSENDYFYASFVDQIGQSYFVGNFSSPAIDVEGFVKLSSGSNDILLVRLPK